MTAESDVVVSLPERLRGSLKEPLGPLFTDATELVAAASGPLVAVGDVVTFHLVSAGTTPAVAVVDGLTEREAVDDAVEAAVEGLASGADATVTVANPAAALSSDLLVALGDALEDDGTTLLVVEGEEDLVTLPAILAAPLGASVVYGQPGEGMVLVEVTAETKRDAAALLRRMDGDYDRLCDLLDVPPSLPDRD